MLIIFNTCVALFLFRNFIKTSSFTPEMIPSPLKLLLSIILWLPRKIDKWFSITRNLLGQYKVDKVQLRNYIKWVRESQIKSRHIEVDRLLDEDSRKLDSIQVIGITLEWKGDHLKYTTVGVEPSFSGLVSGLYAKTEIKRSLVRYLMPFISDRFLDYSIFFHIRYNYLEKQDYVYIINKVYQDDISFLNYLLTQTHETGDKINI